MFSGRTSLPVLLQAEESECGLACIAMVMGFFGHRIDITTLRNRYAISQRGASLKTLIDLADRVNLAGRPLRLEPDRLKELRLPAILHWDMHHFVVLKKVSSRFLSINDPAVGERKIDLSEVGKHFTGIALELSPTEGFVRWDEAKRLGLRDLWSHSRGLYSSLLQLFILSLLLQVFSLALPFYTQLFVDDVLVNRDFDLLKILATGFFVVTLIKCLTDLLRSYVVMYFSNRVSFQFAANVFRHLMKLPLDYFSKRHMGDIVSRFGSLNNVKEFLCSGIVEVVIDGLMVVGTLILMFVYSRIMTFVALIAVVLYVLLRIILYSQMRTRNEEMINNGAMENSNFMENINAIQGIKLFGKESDRMAVWQNFYADMINSGIRVQKLGITLKFAHGLLVGTENIVLMLIGGYAVLNNQISIGMIIAYISFKDQFYSRVFSLLDKVFEFRLLDVHLSRIADIALTPPEQHTQGMGAPPAEVCLEGNLKADNISFRYSRDSPWLFRNINLELDSEESLAIVGPTGCGKSTLLKILLGLLNPSTGTVYMHGVPVFNMGLKTYRGRISAVLQDDALLSGSIFDNITFFDPDPDRERVQYVASLAAIANDIRVMPMQYDTLVGGMGAALSGGQIQRILLARALYRQPRLLVMDEATSHLDLMTEKLVNKAVREMKIARLIVAHRPETIALADRVLQLTPDGLEPISFESGSEVSASRDKETSIAI